MLRAPLAICVLLSAIAGYCGTVQDAPITRFVIGRHTFFDFGPPTDFYEIYVVQARNANSTSVQRFTLTPVADSCTQPAKVEPSAAILDKPISQILEGRDPCSIPEKELSQERKRNKHALVFSGANVTMEVMCGGKTRNIRADIFDRDWFAESPGTPYQTSWTMRLLEQLDKSTGPTVMDKPMFPGAENTPSSSSAAIDPEIAEELSAGKFDSLFDGAPDKPSDIYSSSQVKPVPSTVQLLKSEPVEPISTDGMQYAPIARLAHVEGMVVVHLKVDADGHPTDIKSESGHPMLKGAAEHAVGMWRFPVDAAGQEVRVIIQFKLNCGAERGEKSLEPNGFVLNTQK